MPTSKPAKKRPTTKLAPGERIGVPEGFEEIVALVRSAHAHAYRAVNASLIELYWQVGERISRRVQAAEWGEGVVDELAAYIGRTQPGLRGFTRRNLFRMRQFYDAYRHLENVPSVLTQLPWTHHLMILSQSRRPEERDFYLRMAAQERWSSGELDRQFKAALFERAVLHPAKVSSALAQTRHEGERLIFKDCNATKPHSRTPRDSAN